MAPYAQKLTTEAYCRDPRFEFLLLGVITPEGDTFGYGPRRWSMAKNGQLVEGNQYFVTRAI